jgi:PAS domain-containing protein
VVYVSPACEHVTGLPSNRFMGMMAADWVHPEDVPSAIEQRRLADEDGHSGPTLLRGRHGDGDYHWYEAEWWHVATNHTVLHIRNAQSQQAAITSAVRDLALFTAVLEHSGTVAMRVDPAGPVRFLSGSAAALGWRAGVPAPSTWWSLVHPEDHRRFTATVLGDPSRDAIVHFSDGDGGWRAWRIRTVDLQRDPRVGAVILYATAAS